MSSFRLESRCSDDVRIAPTGALHIPIVILRLVSLGSQSAPYNCQLSIPIACIIN